MRCVPGNTEAASGEKGACLMERFHRAVAAEGEGGAEGPQPAPQKRLAQSTPTRRAERGGPAPAGPHSHITSLHPRALARLLSAHCPPASRRVPSPPSGLRGIPEASRNPDLWAADRTKPTAHSALEGPQRKPRHPSGRSPLPGDGFKRRVGRTRQSEQGLHGAQEERRPGED